MNPRRSATLEALVELARLIDSESRFHAFIRGMRGVIPDPAKKHVSALTGRAVMESQNWLYDRNNKWRLTDLQLLAVMRVEFPLNDGEVFAGDVNAGLKHIASIRAEYNRNGHGGDRPQDRGLPPSVSYGRISPGDRR